MAKLGSFTAAAFFCVGSLYYRDGFNIRILECCSVIIVWNPGGDIFFPLFIRKEITTRKSENKFKQHNISFN